MKRTMLFSLTILLLSGLSILPCPLFAQDIYLPAPEKTGGMPLMEAINLRQSTREFSSKELSQQTLSNLLWTAYGFNREDKRVVPSANNKQSFEVYVALENGIYLYDAKANQLILKVNGDHRAATGKQDYAATAPVNLLYVADYEKQPDRTTSHIDCGFLSQNVYLFCASEGLATVVRGWIDKEAIRNLLGLSEKHEVILAQTVGYRK